MTTITLDNQNFNWLFRQREFMFKQILEYFNNKAEGRRQEAQGKTLFIPSLWITAYGVLTLK
jgi:hypothetical protein